MGLLLCLENKCFQACKYRYFMITCTLDHKLRSYSKSVKLQPTQFSTYRDLYILTSKNDVTRFFWKLTITHMYGTWLFVRDMYLFATGWWMNDACFILNYMHIFRIYVYYLLHIPFIEVLKKMNLNEYRVSGHNGQVFDGNFVYCEFWKLEKVG